MFALAAEDRSALTYGTQARAEGRGLLGATLLGAGIGLGLGAIYLQAGMADHVAERTRAQAMADAAAGGYAGSYLEAEGQGLRYGLERYGFRAGADAQVAAARFDNDRGAAKARRRADLECMTEAVYYEARGESTGGQHAVAQVVMNRVKHPAFPKSVCGVVFQGAGRSGCQFSFTCDGSMLHAREALAWERARKIAGRALAGAIVANVGRATHFHTTAVQPFWAPQMIRISQVGTHVFYRFSPTRLRNANDAVRIEKAVLISGDAAEPAELMVAPTLSDAAVEASLQPAADPAPRAAQPAAKAGPKPAEAAQAAPPPSPAVAALS